MSHTLLEQTPPCSRVLELLCLFFLPLSGLLQAQGPLNPAHSASPAASVGATFTRITTGSIATDGGDSSGVACAPKRGGSELKTLLADSVDSADARCKPLEAPGLRLRHHPSKRPEPVARRQC